AVAQGRSPHAGPSATRHPATLDPTDSVARHAWPPTTAAQTTTAAPPQPVRLAPPTALPPMMWLPPSAGGRWLAVQPTFAAVDRRAYTETRAGRAHRASIAPADPPLGGKTDRSWSAWRTRPRASAGYRHPRTPCARRPTIPSYPRRSS